MKIKPGLNLLLIVVTIFALTLGILNPVAISKNNVKAYTYRNELPENEVVTLNENQLSKIEFYLLNPLTKNQNDAVSKITNGGKYEDGKLLYKWEAEPTNYNEDLINTIEYDGVNQPKIEITKLYFENDDDEIYYSFDNKEFFNKYFDFKITFDKNKPLLTINIKGKTDFLKFEKSVEFSKFINEPIENVNSEDDNANGSNTGLKTTITGSKDKKTAIADLKFCKSNIIDIREYMHQFPSSQPTFYSDGNLFDLLKNDLSKTVRNNIKFSIVFCNKNAFKLHKSGNSDIGFYTYRKDIGTEGLAKFTKPYNCGSCYLKVYDKTNSTIYDIVKVVSDKSLLNFDYFWTNKRERIVGMKKINKNKIRIKFSGITSKTSNLVEGDYKKYIFKCTDDGYKKIRSYTIKVTSKNYNKKYHYITMNIKGVKNIQIYPQYIWNEGKGRLGIEGSIPGQRFYLSAYMIWRKADISKDDDYLGSYDIDMTKLSKKRYSKINYNKLSVKY